MKSTLTPLAVTTTWKGPHFLGGDRFNMSARKVAEALLSRDQTMVWLKSTLTLHSYDGDRSALVERAAESADCDSHRNQHQHKQRDRIVVQIRKARAFEHDRAYNSYIMRERQRLTDPLCPGRHAREWKYKPGQKDVRQEKHHRHLHGLQLILCHGRERVAN